MSNIPETDCATVVVSAVKEAAALLEAAVVKSPVTAGEDAAVMVPAAVLAEPST
jgi:hypothetical protein